MNSIVIKGLVKQEIPVLKNGEVQKIEVGFFFGTLTFKLIKSNFNLDLKDIDEKVKLISTDPLEGLDFVVNFLFTAHESWQRLNQSKPLIDKDQLWLTMELMGPEEFAKILEEGLNDYIQDQEEEQDKKKVVKNTSK